MSLYKERPFGNGNFALPEGDGATWKRADLPVHPLAEKIEDPSGNLSLHQEIPYDLSQITPGPGAGFCER